jgi:transposase
MRKTYHTDLSDSEWARIEPYLPVPKAPGRPRIHSPREILNAIFYIVRSGCAWRLLPHDFPLWRTVHHYFRIWRIDGVWERLNTACASVYGVRLGRNSHPSHWVGRLGRLTGSQDDRSGRRGAGLRWREEGPWSKATLTGGYGRVGAQS